MEMKNSKNQKSITKIIEGIEIIFTRKRTKFPTFDGLFHISYSWICEFKDDPSYGCRSKGRNHLFSQLEYQIKAYKM